jgi:hypothetical protein
MLSLSVTLLRIGSQDCLDKATATLNNCMIAGVVYQLLIPPAKQRSFQNVLDPKNNVESRIKIKTQKVLEVLRHPSVYKS